jgi:hypothetical protein
MLLHRTREIGQQKLFAPMEIFLDGQIVGLSIAIQDVEERNNHANHNI